MFKQSETLQVKGRFHAFVVVVLFAASLALGLLLMLLAITLPLGDVMNVYLSKAAGHDASWFRDITAVVLGLFLLGSYFAVDSTVPARTYPAWGRALLGLFASVIFILVSFLLLGFIYILWIKGETMFFIARFAAIKWELAAIAGLSLVGMTFPYFGFWRRPRLRWFACVTAIVIAMAFAMRPASVRIDVGPWLQLGENGAITVGWITDEPSTGWVEYGDDLKLRAHASRHGLIDAGTRVHHVTLTGLVSGANVPYRVAVRKMGNIGPVGADIGPEIYSERHVFKAPSSSGDSVSFAMFCDLHDAVNLWPEVMEKADARHRDFVVLNGDVLSEVNDERQLIEHFLKPASSLFAAETPFLFIRGNHEARGDFARALEAYVGISEERPYDGLFRVGPVAFLGLDSGEDKPDNHPEYAGLVDFSAWRAEQQGLIGPMTSGANWKYAPFRVLLAHIPLSDDHQWISALNEAGVELQLAGHEHRLEYREPKGARLFPIIIGSGDVRKNPSKYNYAIGKATTTELAVDVISCTGETVGHYVYPSKR
jgi:predicted MPP superfamily phosphohydrolase